MRRWGDGQTKDSAAMVIFDERVNRGFTGASADGDDAEFTCEWDEFFEDVWNSVRSGLCSCGWKLRLCSRDVVGSAQVPLAFAVVAHAAGFQNRGQADFLYGCVQIVAAPDRLELCRRNSQFPEQGLFIDPILGDFQRLGGR